MRTWIVIAAMAVLIGGCSTTTDSPYQPLPELGAPTDLVAGAVSSSQIDLSWHDNADQEAGFIVQHQQVSGPWISLPANSANDTTFSDTGLVAGVTYDYRVCAFNDGDSSAWSNVASAAINSMQPAVWVVNSLGESLSKVNLTTQEVIVNALILDSAPNDIAVFDDRAYVVNSLSNNVQILNLYLEQTLGTIEILKGMNPYYIVIENEQRAFVSNWLTGNVSVLDLVSATETDSITTGGVPQDLCVTSDRLFVTDVNLDLQSFAYGPGRLLAYSLATLEFVDEVEVGMNPQIVELGPYGNLHVVCTGDFGAVTGQVYIVDPQSLTVEQTIDIGGSPGSLAFNSQNIACLGSVAWAGEGWLLTYDAITYQIIRGASNPIILPSSAMDVACSQNDHIFAACFNTDQLIELDENDVIVQSYTVGDGPIAVAIRE